MRNIVVVQSSGAVRKMGIIMCCCLIFIWENGEKKGNEGKSQDNSDEWGKTSSYPDSRTFDLQNNGVI